MRNASPITLSAHHAARRGVFAARPGGPPVRLLPQDVDPHDLSVASTTGVAGPERPIGTTFATFVTLVPLATDFAALWPDDTRTDDYHLIRGVRFDDEGRVLGEIHLGAPSGPLRSHDAESVSAASTGGGSALAWIASGNVPQSSYEPVVEFQALGCFAAP